MGTAVLNPQDCLSSPHRRQRDNFPGLLCRSSSLGRSRKSGPPSPLASYMATTSSNGQKDQDADNRKTAGRLLPSLDDCSQSRTFALSRSPSQSSPSLSGRSIQSVSAARFARTFSVPSSPSRHTSPPLSSLKPGTQRSVSSGFPPRKPPTSGYAREAPSPVSGRFPSKSVQGGASGQFSTANARQNFQILPKFRDSKGLAQRMQRVGANNHVSDLKKRTSYDVSVGLVGKSSAKPTHRTQEGSYEVTGLMKEVGVRKCGRGKSEVNDGEKMQGSFTAVTILQRPKDKEAAEELIASFFRKVGSSPPPDGSDMESVKAEGGSESDDMSCDDLESKCSTCSSADVSPSSRTLQHEHCNSGSRCGLGSNTQVGDVVELVDEATGPSHINTVKVIASGDLSSRFSAMVGNDQWIPLLDSEKWAGPAYFNSPPPSSLPLPSFSMKQSRTESPGFSTIAYQEVESLSVGSPPGILRTQSGCTWDITFATKDLRRMLNLDLFST